MARIRTAEAVLSSALSPFLGFLYITLMASFGSIMQDLRLNKSFIHHILSSFVCFYPVFELRCTVSNLQFESLI